MKFLGLLTLIILVGCSAKVDEASLAKLLNEKPDLIFKVLENHPEAFIKAAQNAGRKAQGARGQEKQEPEEDIEGEFKNPKQPQVDPSRIVGDVSAPILIVEYTDFECPFCSRGHDTMKELKQMYGSKIKVLKKHLPLPMHEHAKIAALYYEAVASAYSLEKAHAWANEIFINQSKFRSGDVTKFFDETSKKVKLDTKKIAAILNDNYKMSAFENKINEDMEEAKKFQFMGTPGFLINGVSLKGAYPAPMFKQIIDRHLAK